MVRKPKAADTESSAPKDPRARIVAALMTLAAERDFDDITIADITETAGLGLADFREAFPSKGAVLAGFARQTDLAVLRGTGADMADEPAKDRLFDVLMRRLDAMAPHKAALKNILRWAGRNPLSAAALNGVALNSMRFMLEAAGLPGEGPGGALKLQGLTLAWRRVLGVWFRDEDDGNARTMAALDKELTRGGAMVARLEDFERLTAPLRSFCDGLSNARRGLRDGLRDGSRHRERWSGGEGAADAPAS